MSDKVAVLVAGSWGTALASVLASNDLDVVVWTRTEEQTREINESHTNNRYLPGVELPPNIRATTDMKEAVSSVRRGYRCAFVRDAGEWPTEEILDRRHAGASRNQRL